MEGGWVLVLTTTSTYEEAEKIARHLLENKAVACVNIVKSVRSLYWWKGSIESSEESLLIIKTRLEKLVEVENLIKRLHSYEVPEIIVLPVIAGSKEYLEWLNKSVETV
ncbi:divalent-cation tolerance protein CutA [Thermogladius sp. 4427co]|uniref:divalent-cation tolerance protein CutA n=1 Tax=Thermogladius sp. 4427co TaxID=3450718 RepID=UPI003F79311D